MKLVSIDHLKHIENFSTKRVDNILVKMQSSGIWERPICVEKKHMLILDGQHRYEVAVKLGISYIPCELFDYDDDRLIVWSLRKNCTVSKKLVVKRANSGDIYPYKTAKHKFPRKVNKCFLPIKDLVKYNDRKDLIIET